MNKEITIYGASWCGPCQSVKRYFDQKEIRYSYIDTDEHPEEMPEGYKSIPIIRINGEYIVGFDQPKLLEVLKS